MPRCSTAYAWCSSRSPLSAEGGPRLIVPAVWDQPRVHLYWPSPLHTPEDWRTYARAIRREVLNAHLLGVRPQLVDGGATDHPGCQFQALLAVVYWHLLQLAAQGIVQRCAEASCQAFFVPTRRTQRFCPPEAPARAQPVCGPRAAPEAGPAPARGTLATTSARAAVQPMRAMARRVSGARRTASGGLPPAACDRQCRVGGHGRGCGPCREA